MMIDGDIIEWAARRSCCDDYGKCGGGNEPSGMIMNRAKRDSGRMIQQNDTKLKQVEWAVRRGSRWTVWRFLLRVSREAKELSWSMVVVDVIGNIDNDGGGGSEWAVRRGRWMSTRVSRQAREQMDDVQDIILERASRQAKEPSIVTSLWILMVMLTMELMEWNEVEDISFILLNSKFWIEIEIEIEIGFGAEFDFLEGTL